MAVAGLVTPSMAAAISGSSNRKASISQERSTSSGSRVRRLGTMAMSSSPYARRPDLPMPISISATLVLFGSWVPHRPSDREPGPDAVRPTPLRAVTGVRKEASLGALRREVRLLAGRRGGLTLR